MWGSAYQSSIKILYWSATVSVFKAFQVVCVQLLLIFKGSKRDFQALSRTFKHSRGLSSALKDCVNPGVGERGEWGGGESF